MFLRRIAFKALRRLSIAPRTLPWRHLLARLQHPVQRPTRLLLVSDRGASTSEEQFSPLFRHAAALRRDLGLLVSWTTLGDHQAWTEQRLKGFDLVGLKLNFRTPAPVAAEIAARFRQACDANGARLIYFDGDDDLNVQWPEVIVQSDLYVKKHLHADLANYRKDYVGKSNLTDYVARNHGRSFADDIIPTTTPLPEPDIAKLHLGWNIGLDDKIFELSKNLEAPKPARHRSIDISCRAAVPPSVWTHPLRERLIQVLEPEPAGLRILTPRDRVTPAQYYREMLDSRICVSPFGFGELCWRDFEAILCGCLLVKPDMGHLRTAPDLFVPGETYVPVAWDYSDLETVCRRWLADEAGLQRVVEQGRSRLLTALEQPWFVATVRHMLEALPPSKPTR